MGSSVSLDPFQGDAYEGAVSIFGPQGAFPVMTR